MHILIMGLVLRTGSFWNRRTRKHGTAYIRKDTPIYGQIVIVISGERKRFKES